MKFPRLDLALAVGTLAACAGGGGGGGTTNPPPTPVLSSVAIAPKSFGLTVGGTQQFTASPKDQNGAAIGATVTWNATGGTVNASGLYTATTALANAKVWATAGTFNDTASGSVAAVQATQLDTVFFETWEAGNFNQWDDRGLTGNQTIVNNAGLAHSGTRALQVTYPATSDGGWLTNFFLPGYDSLYVRYWVFLEAGWQLGTKFVSFYGSRTDNQWSATGQAGVCPSGTDYFNLTIAQETNGNPGPTHFYTYYAAMPQTPSGSGVCFGDAGIRPGAATYTTPLTVAPGGWHMLEFWAVLNTPGQSNFLERFCVDGVVRGTWSGISVRSNAILKLNAVTLSNSISGGSAQTQHQWIDDLLVTQQRPAGAC